MNPHFSPQLNAFACTGYLSNYEQNGMCRVLYIGTVYLYIYPSWKLRTLHEGGLTSSSGDSASADPMAPRMVPLGGDFLRGHRFEVDIGGRRFPVTASLYAPRFRPFEIVPLADASLRIH